MSDRKLPHDWVKKLSKTKNKSYFFNIATGESVWSQPETCSTSPTNSSVKKLNSRSIVIKKSPAQDRLQRIQQELIAKQLTNNTKASAITKTNNARSTHRSSSTNQSDWRSAPNNAAKHNNWASNTTKSTPSNPKFTKTNLSSIPTPKNIKTSVAIPKQDSTNLSRNIKLPTVPLSNRLKFSKIPKTTDIFFVEKHLPNASEPKIGNYNQNDRKRKPDNVQQAYKTHLGDGTKIPNPKRKCASKADSLESNIGSAKSQVGSIPPNLPEAAALSNRNNENTESTAQVKVADASVVGQKRALSNDSLVQPNPTLFNVVLPAVGTPISESTTQAPPPKPFKLPDPVSNCDAAQRSESSSIFAGFFSGLKSLWGVTTTVQEPALNKDDTLSSRQLVSETNFGNGILDSSKQDLSAIQQRLQLDKDVIPPFEDHNAKPIVNIALDDVDVEMTDDDDITSDSNESMEWENDVAKTVEIAKAPVPETVPKPEPSIQTPGEPLEIISSSASKRTSGLSLVNQRLLIHKSPEPRVIPDKVPIRQYSPPPTNYTKRKLTIEPGETILVVIDTNIFLNSLSFVKNLVGQRLKLKGNPTLMVPYQVLQELDNIKDCSKKNETIKSLAMGSIKYLEKYLQGSDEYVQAQSVQDNQRNIIDIGSPDDHILNCCLQCQSLESKHIVLLSNDINLRNKALCSKVAAFSMAQLAEELNIK